MSRIRVKRTGSQKIEKTAIAKIQAWLAQSRDTNREYDRGRFVWGFLIGLSSLALGLYHPALAQDEPGRDRQPAPREPERNTDPWNQFPGIRPEMDPVDHPLWPDGRRRRGPALRLAAQQDADGPPTQRFDIPAGDLRTALTTFSRQTDLQLLYLAELVEGRQTQGLQGNYTAEEALAALLSGTGLQYRFSDPKTVILQRAGRSEDLGPPAPGAAQADDKPVKVSEVVIREKIDIDYSGKYDIDQGFKAEYQSSATKTPLSIRETPQSISVITRDSLDARFARDQGTALEVAAGALVPGGPGPFAGRPSAFEQRFVFRGVLLDETLNIREDGFVVPADRFSPDLSVYERIEVVKGPASALYGAGAAGGFLNRVRKKPLPEAFYQARITGGSFGLFRNELDATGPLNRSRTIRGRMVATFERGDSFVDHVQSDVFVLAPSIEADVTQSTRLLGQFLYQKDRFVPNFGTPLLARDGKFVAPNTPRSQYNGVPTDLSQNGNEVVLGTVQADQKITDGWLATLRLNYNRVRHKSFKDRYPFGLSNAGDTYIYSRVDDSVTDTYTSELRLNGKFNLFGRQHQVLVGGELEHRREERFFTYNYLGVGNIYAANFSTFPALGKSGVTDNLQDTTFTRTRKGVYSQLILNPVERLKLLVGGRYDSADQKVTDTTTAAAITDFTSSAVTGRAGLVYDLSENVSAYGTIAQSFIPVTAQNAALEILPPTRGLLYELGVKTEWLDRRLGINAAIFRLDRKNVPIPDPNTGNRFSIAAGLQRNDGIELEINGRPMPGWDVTVAGTLLDSEYIDPRDPNFGRRPRFTAPWQLGAFSTYELQSGVLKGFGFGAGLFAIGERAVEDSRSEHIDGYKRVDLTIFYNGFKNLKVSVYVRNLLNETYIERPLSAFQLSQYGAPLTVAARVDLLYW